MITVIIDCDRCGKNVKKIGADIPGELDDLIYELRGADMMNNRFCPDCYTAFKKLKSDLGLRQEKERDEIYAKFMQNAKVVIE